MARTANFSSIPIVGAAAVSATADTSYTAPTNTVTLLTATGPRQITGSVTSASTTLTSTAVQNGDIGRPVSGTGIPAGTIILAVVAGTSATLSKPASATHATEAVTLGGGTGLKVQQVACVGNSASATVAGMVNIFLKDAAGTFHFIATFKITAVTPSATTPAFGAKVNTTATTSTWKPVNLWLPPNWSLCATSFVASQNINVTAMAGAF